MGRCPGFTEENQGTFENKVNCYWGIYNHNYLGKGNVHTKMELSMIAYLPVARIIERVPEIIALDIQKFQILTFEFTSTIV
jgi:hypothetical protein